MTEQRPLLEVDDFSISYSAPQGEVRAVRHVGFTVGRGERLGIVGESGSGKSSIALGLMRLLQPSARMAAGAVRLNGRDLLGLTDRDFDDIRGRDISLIFQDPMSALDPVRRIGAQLVEGLRVHDPSLSRRAARRRAAEALREVEIPRAEERLRQYPHELSGGLRQRVVIALALAHQPAVVIADEPTTALDVTTQKQILALLDRLVSERGTSVIIITHNFAVVAEFCDTVDVMYAGRIVERGRTEELFESPSHPYTRALLRCVPRVGQDPTQPLPSIPGAPTYLARPEGCAYAPRCEFAQPRCSSAAPPIARTSTGTVECHFPDAWDRDTP